MVSSEESGSDIDNSSHDLSSSVRSLFSEGEKVSAEHDGHYYEAKVRKAEFENNEWRYLVHYHGWSKNWDEWVDTSRLFKHSDKSVSKKQSLDKKQRNDKITKSGHSTQAKSRSNAGSKERKHKLDLLIEKDSISPGKLCIRIPSALKKQLVDDWENVTEQNKLVKLPRSPSVEDIFAKYSEYQSNRDGKITDSAGEILNGLQCYFDKTLPVSLLYKSERQQYKEVVSGIAPSSVYGAEHLLRLFVKLPELLDNLTIEEDTLARIEHELQNFLRYLQENQEAFFLSSYDRQKISEGGGKKKCNKANKTGLPKSETSSASVA